MMTGTSDSPLANWSLDREVVLTRVYDHPVEAVFAAWVDPAAFCEWFGPDAFTCEVHEHDVRTGGRSRFDMVVIADGTVMPNQMDFVDVVENERLVFDHGTGAEDDPNLFRVTVTFDAEPEGRTVLTLRQIHPTAERRTQVIGFGAVSLGLQTFGKLGSYLDAA